MLCNFVQINDKLICENCGRKTVLKKDSFYPTAKCRIPEHINLKLGYVYNKKTKGVGDTLSELIKKLDYSYPPIGSVRAKLTMLNKQGIDWCDKNQELIHDWVKYECAIQGIPLKNNIGRAIIRLAIKQAKNQVIDI